jgi:dihydrolipoamide dehydrogenase
MENNEYQVLVIGSGPGGYVAAIRAAQLGFKVACVEKMDTVGGTCLNVGCIPSKALLQSSESYDWIVNSSKEQGITVSNAVYDFSAMLKRKEGIVKLLVDGVASHFKKHKIDWLKGSAKFINNHEVEVDGKRYRAENIIIATGSEPVALPFLPFDEKRVLSSTGALALKTVPKKMAVIGAGAIGVELASVYRRLGSEIVVIEMLDVITPGMDQSLSKQLQQTLKKQGMEFLLGAKVAAAKVTDQGVSLTVEYEQKVLSIDADVVLVAVGRKPYTQGLDLEAAGISLGPKGLISVDGNFRTAQPNIFAIGDVIDGPMLAHKATHEGMAVAEIIAGESPSINYLSIPNVIYTHPEVASVGLTEAEAVAAGLDVVTGVSFFRGNARARCSGDIEGFVKVLGDKKSGRLVGMHIIGGHASELIAEGMIALDKKATIADLVHACHAHPTLSETIMEACQQALGYPIHG